MPTSARGHGDMPLRWPLQLAVCLHTCHCHTCHTVTPVAPHLCTPPHPCILMRSQGHHRLLFYQPCLP